MILDRWQRECLEHMQMRDATRQEQESVNNYVKSISHEIITLDTNEIENVLNVRTDGKYCKFTDKYLITVTRR